MLKNNYSRLLKEIRQLVAQSRQAIVRNINTELLRTYWNVGRLIVDKENSEHFDETSVRNMLIDISKELTRDLGKGFSRSQLTYMRLFFLRFPVFDPPPKFGVTLSHQNQKNKKNQKKYAGLTVSHQLSWSHYYELLKCSGDAETRFYLQAAVNENWSVRELRRQIDAALYERVVSVKRKKGSLRISSRGKMAQLQTDIAKDPYVLEFLDIPEHHLLTEKQFEQKIIDNLQKFVLELGKGFAFVARQFRISLNNKHYRVDLVFYHRILKCFVLIDLKIKPVEHSDIGQMNLYLNYFEAEQNVKGDNPPIGIILAKYKDDITVEYAIKGISNKIFVSKYQLYLPDKKMLRNKMKELL